MTSEKLDVLRDVLGSERNEIDDGVEAVVAERGSHGRRFSNVAAQHMNAGRNGARRLATPQVEEIDASRDGDVRARRADDAGPADIKDLHDGSAYEPASASASASL